MAPIKFKIFHRNAIFEIKDHLCLAVAPYFLEIPPPVRYSRCQLLSLPQKRIEGINVMPHHTTINSLEDGCTQNHTHVHTSTQKQF